MKKNVHVVIMAGGTGKRFWPFSTLERPKQFLDLTGDGTLLGLTLDRVRSFAPEENVWVLTNQKYRGIVAEQAPWMVPEQIVGEPMLRDTSAAVALGAGLVAAKDPEAVMVILPADHVIVDRKGFAATIEKAVDQAEKGEFVTVGIKPTYPSEGFGYLERGDALEADGAYALRRFVEKPEKSVAEQYLASGNYYWNAGMFIWRASNLMEQLRRHLPEHAAMAEKLGEAAGASDWQDLAAKEFEPLEKISIDFGLMEKLESITTVEAAFDWNDVGGWLALEELIGPDAAGNTVKGRCVTKDASGNIIVSEDGCGPVIVSGISDSVIIAAKAGTLVCSKAEVERIKSLVEQVL